jgi:hypothetical protein
VTEFDYTLVRAKAQEIQQNAHAVCLEKLGEKCAVDIVAAVEGDIGTGQTPDSIMRNLHSINISNWAQPRSKWHPR